MRRDRAIGLILACATACHGTSTRRPPEPPAERLISTPYGLYITDVYAGAKRGNVFTVLSRDPVPGSHDHRRVALVEGLRMHGRNLEVTERCPVPLAERPALTGEGLRVVPLPEDTRPRVGKCFTTYELPRDAWDLSPVHVDLRLDVGGGDGVRPGDRYEILGRPIADSLNRTVPGFEQLGECVVQLEISELHARCRLDRKQWRAFTRDHALAGGYAELLGP